MRIEKYGATGEKLSDAQMVLFELDPVVSETIEQAESEHASAHRPTKRSTKHPGRQELPSNLPRVERILPCTPDQRVCKRCGKETIVIGYEESSQLDVEPAKYFVLVTKREKRACRSCEELGVVSAPLPPRIIEKCLASDRIVIDTVVSKYCNHTPLHRQSVILERDIGLEISRATLDGWVLKVGELLIPMVAAMRRELISGSYIQADETPVDVQMHEGRGKNHQAYLWQYGRPGGSVVFDFRLGRGRDGPKRFLGRFEGILQTDGYTAYDQIGGRRMVHARLLGSCQKTVFRGGAAQSPRPGCNSDCGAHGRAVCRRRRSTPQSNWSHWASCSASGKSQASPGRYPEQDRGSTVRCIALQRTQQGVPIRAHAVDETYTIPGTSGT
jgi:transposase